MGGEATVAGGLRLGIDRAWRRVLDRGAPINNYGVRA
jgi:hypothetical protein